MTDFLEFCAAHKAAIAAISATVCIGAGFLFELLRRKVLPEERWAGFFGGTLIILGILHLLSVGMGLLEKPQPRRYAELKPFVGHIVLVGSAINNTLLFGAGRLLLGRSPFPRALLVTAALPFLFGFGDFLFKTSIGDGLDGVISGAILVYFGHALAINLSHRRPTWAARTARVTTIAYAVCALGNGILPTIYAPSKAWMPFINVFTLLLKVVLVLLTVTLIVRSLSSFRPRTARRITKAYTQERLNPMDPDGLPLSIAESTSADLAELCVLLPGEETQRVLFTRWPEVRLDSPYRGRVQPRPPADTSAIGRVLSTGEVLVVPNIEAYRNDGGAYRDHLSGMHSCIVAPIRFHGAVIGAVNIEWKPGFRFSLTARRRILSFAETIAPYADQLRQLAAVDLCNTRFAKEELDRPLSLERPAGTWLSIVRDILGVPGAALSIDVGFGPPRVAVCDRSICTQVDDMEAAQAFLGCLEGHVREPLRIGSLQIGELLLCVSKASLGAEPFVRDAVSSLVANGVLDAARVQHAHVLNQMQIDLGKTGLRDEGGWSQVLTTAAESMHFEWLVVANSEGCVCLESPHSDAIEALLAAGDLGKEVNPLPTPVGSARCALRIDLPETDRVLLLGFGKTDFGVELSPTYPWRIFVDRFRESADAALVRIRSAQALLRSQKEAFMYQASAQMVATAGSLAHQAVNLSRDISSSAHNVREAILTGEVQVSPSVERAVIALGRSTRNLHALMSGIRRIEVFDEKCPCDVSDAFRMVRRQHETTIFERGAKLTFPESLLPQVNVPLHALTLALSNLVDNACDAFKRAKSQKRHIEITADWWGDRLQLRVADTGPGVDPELAGRIFDPGISCKPQSGGWGLYLVRECLRHYDARIELQPQCEGGAVFVINLPAQEERES